MPNPPILIKPIPSQVVNEGAAFGPFNLNDFIQSPDAESGSLRFQAELANGNALITGLICTSNGIVSGIPAKGTEGEYQIKITAQNDAETPLQAEFNLSVKSRVAFETDEDFTKLKARVWEALGKDLPIPDIGDILNRPVTPAEIYYLLQRFATLTIWDVYNLDPPGPLQPLQLEGCSEHYHIYDRGSCLVVSPKELFSHQRTLEDALQSARVAAKEVFNRGWVIEFSGFNKMIRAAWIEIQILSDKYNKKMEILHYTPSEEDVRIYEGRASAPNLKI